MSSILGDIARAIEAAAPGWDVTVGFSTSAGEWAEENRVGAKTILVSLDSDEPTRYSERGTVRSYLTSGSVYMRARASVTEFEEDIRPVYKAIRAALDGLSVTEDGESFLVQIGAGNTAMSNGYALPVLQWVAQ